MFHTRSYKIIQGSFMMPVEVTMATIDLMPFSCWIDAGFMLN